MALLSSDFDDRFYKLIGQIVVSFNSLEAELRECVARPPGADTDLGIVVLCRVSFSDLVDMFKVAACFATKSRPDCAELEARISGLVTDLKKANENRNRIVHSHYGDSIEIHGEPEEGDLQEERILSRTKFKRELEHQKYIPAESKGQVGPSRGLFGVRSVE